MSEDKLNREFIAEKFLELDELPRDQQELALAEMPTEMFEEVNELRVLLAIDASKDFQEAFEPVDNYDLIEPLGSGAQSRVFRALDREKNIEVALKVIHGDWEMASVRFERECDLLQRMDHEHIASFIAKSPKESQHRYIALEYVEGEPVTGFVDNRKLLLHDRLEIFLKICSAVQHAHSKGVTHRDIKPDNILVKNDEPPCPFLIDFGIAKVDQTEMELGPSTGLGRIVGTPQYLSPEQAEFKTDVDTLSDIYSLGIVLYELLTGKIPHRFDENDDIQSIGEKLKSVIPKPSNELQKESAFIPDGIWNGTVNGYRRQLTNDLDWIVWKACQPRREERYATVDALANDVRAYINREPISAHPPSWPYRAWKSVKRNAVLSSTLATAFVGLIVATIISINWYLSVVSKNSKLEENSTTIATQNTELNSKTEELIKQKNVATKAIKIVSQLSSPLNDYARQNPGDRSVNNLYSLIVQFLDSAIAEDPNKLETQREAANALMNRAGLEHIQGEIKAAIESKREVVARFRRMRIQFSDDTVLPYHLATAVNNLAQELADDGQRVEALKLFSEVHEIRKIELEKYPTKTFALSEVLQAKIQLAKIAIESNDFAAAKPLLTKSIKGYEMLCSIPDRLNGHEEMLWYLAEALTSNANIEPDSDKQVQLYEKAVDRMKLFLKHSNSVTYQKRLIDIKFAYARSLANVTKIEEAENVYKEANVLLTKLVSNHPQLDFSKEQKLRQRTEKMINGN